MNHIYLTVKLKLETLWTSIRALKTLSDIHHEKAFFEYGEKEQKEKRDEAEALNRAANEVRAAMTKAIEKKE